MGEDKKRTTNRPELNEIRVINKRYVQWHDYEQNTANPLINVSDGDFE